MKKLLCMAVSSALLLISCASTPAARTEIKETPAPAVVNGTTITLTGVVAEVTAEKGTLSEYSWFVLKTPAGETLTLFNQQGLSGGFAEWKDKTVRIEGTRSTGKIGFRGKKVPGITVQLIQLSN